MPTSLPAAALKVGDYVRHKVFAYRGDGKVLKKGQTFLPSQTPKFHVGFERGGPLWVFPDDLIVIQKAAAPRPTLTVVEQPGAA